MKINLSNFSESHVSFLLSCDAEHNKQTPTEVADDDDDDDYTSINIYLSAFTCFAHKIY